MQGAPSPGSAESSSSAIDKKASNPQEGRASSRFAVATSLLSLCVALFGAGFTVLRAGADDQSKLRTELTETVRLLSTIKPGTDTSNELSAVLAQIAQIIHRVHNVPATYYRRLGEGFEVNLRFPEAVAALRQSIRLAVSQNSPIDIATGYKSLAHVYYTVGDTAEMRKEYAASLQVNGSNSLLSAGLRNATPVTLALWAVDEAILGNCQVARNLYAKALRATLAVPRANRKVILTTAATPERNQLVTHCQVSTGSDGR
jgi:hypothetical protein